MGNLLSSRKQSLVYTKPLEKAEQKNMKDTKQYLDSTLDKYTDEEGKVDVSKYILRAKEDHSQRKKQKEEDEKRIAIKTHYDRYYSFYYDRLINNRDEVVNELTKRYIEKLCDKIVISALEIGALHIPGDHLFGMLNEIITNIEPIVKKSYGPNFGLRLVWLALIPQIELYWTL